MDDNKQRKKLEKIIGLTLSDGKNYVLASDGNIYCKDEDGKVKKLDKNNPNDKKMIDEMGEYTSPPKIDVIYNDERE